MTEQNAEYAVMWDYNVGLVRMTPFFKCRGYGKASKRTSLHIHILTVNGIDNSGKDVGPQSRAQRNHT